MFRLKELIYNRFVLFFIFGAYQATGFAGFLELPDITESPTLERKTYLRDMDIPSVRERNPDPASGPRLAVSEFRLQGIVEFPDLGITREAIGKVVEAIRFDMMAEDKLLESGYTAEELGELSDLLVKIEDETIERHVGPLEVQRLVWLIREQRANRGITLGMIETVADKITNFYRERGFILAKAYIPKQEVREGIVTLTLLLGVLGEVKVKNNKLYNSDYISSVFDDMLTVPITNKNVDEKLYLLNDYPGLNLTGFFEPGAQVGDTKLNLNVTSERIYDSSIRVDNHGTKETGEYRLYGEVMVNNLLGYADLLHIGALYAFEPDNATYYQFRYGANVLSPRFNVSAGFSKNEFILGEGNSGAVNTLKLKGATNLSDIKLSYKIKRSRTSTHSVDFIADKADSILRVGALEGTGDIGLDDELENLSLVYNFDVLHEQNQQLHQGSIRYIDGKFIKGLSEGQKEQYSIYQVNYVFLTFWRLPYFHNTTRIIVRSSLQYSGQALSSISQFGLSGPTRVRGYSVNRFFADDGGHLGAEMIFPINSFSAISIGNINLKDIVQPFIFADIGYGKTYSLDPAQKDTTATLSDIGFGFKFSYLGRLSSSLQFAFPQQNKISREDIVAAKDSVKVVFDLNYRF